MQRKYWAIYVLLQSAAILYLLTLHDVHGDGVGLGVAGAALVLARLLHPGQGEGEVAEGGLAPAPRHRLDLARVPRAEVQQLPGLYHLLFIRAAKDPSVFTITEKAPTRKH